MLRRFIVGDWKIILYSDEYNTDTLIPYGSCASAFIAVRVSAMRMSAVLSRLQALMSIMALVKAYTEGRVLVMFTCYMRAVLLRGYLQGLTFESVLLCAYVQGLTFVFW